MPPNATSVVECTGVLNECDAETIDGGLDKNVVELKHADKDRKLTLVWRNILIFSYVHLAALYGAYLILSSARIYTSIFGNLILLFFIFAFKFKNVKNHIHFVLFSKYLQLWYCIYLLD